MSVKDHSPCLAVTVAGDIGGAKAIGPVIAELTADPDWGVRAYSYGPATEYWTQCGFPVQQLEGSAHLDSCRAILVRDRADCLLAGTSWKSGHWETTFMAAAHLCDRPSLVVLDYWSNYQERFRDSTGRMQLPDRIAVMDEYARKEMIVAGFPAERLEVTGQPAFDEVRPPSAEEISKRRDRIRKWLRFDASELLIVFASQPISELYADADDQHPGYTEMTVLRELIATLEHLSLRADRPITLLVRPHPREEEQEYRRLSSERIRIVVSKERDARTVISAADLVTGMSTCLLLEACLMGCPVVSLQPGLRTIDMLPTNRWGISRAVYEVREFDEVLSQCLLDADLGSDNRARAESFLPDGQATERVKRELRKLVDSRWKVRKGVA